jgi:hypothetical protein
LQRSENIPCRHAQRRKLGEGKLDEDLFGAFAEDVDLLDAGDVQEVLADHLSLPDQFAHRHALRLQRVKGEAHVGVLVVDKRAEDAGRQVASFIAQLLAGLVELLPHGRRRCAVLERHRHVGVTGPRGRLHAVVPGQFLNPLLQWFGDEVLHFARSCARPRRRHRQGLDRE